MMYHMYHLALISFLAYTVGQDEQSGTIVLDKDSEGKVPSGWKQHGTGPGTGGWRVVADKTAPGGKGFVLAQIAKNPGNVFNVGVFEGVSAKNVELKVHFKAHKGEVDQGGG